jgi:hypothetical protein
MDADGHRFEAGFTHGILAAPAHGAHTLNYLRATPIEVALLLNFGPTPQFKRFAFVNVGKQICVHLRSSAANPPESRA